MRFNNQENIRLLLSEHADQYELLGSNIDTLNENINDINAHLSQDEKYELATNIVLKCPNDPNKFRELARSIRNCFHPQDPNHFSTILFKAVELANQIHSITDKRNQCPADFWLTETASEKESGTGLTETCRKFSTLSRTLVNRNLQDIVKAFTDKTAEKDMPLLRKRLSELFPDTTLLIELNRHNQEGIPKIDINLVKECQSNFFKGLSPRASTDAVSYEAGLQTTPSSPR